MSRILFVINKDSSVGETSAFIERARLFLDQKGAKGVSGRLQCQFFIPHNINEFQCIDEVAKEHKASTIVVVGGDGTANLCLPALKRARIPAYFFAAGTANDLAQACGHKPSWLALRKAVTLGKVRSIDLLQVNGILFATVGGLGVGSVLTAEMNTLRCQSALFKKFAQILHKHTYSLLALKTIASGQYPRMPLTLKTDRGQSMDITSGCVLIGNQNFLGGSIRIQPQARNDDGLLDAFVLLNPSKTALISALIAMRSGHIPADTVQLSAQEMTITSQTDKDNGGNDLVFFADGETLLTASRFELKTLKGCLLVHEPVERSKQ
jgi:diacylglycerol kinase family enzyme